MLRSRGMVSPGHTLLLLVINFVALSRAGPLGPLPNVTSVDLGFKEGSCALGDVVYMAGDEFPGSTPCEKCACTSGGVQCEKQVCEQRPGCKALHRPDHCCPTYQCECEQEGRVYGNGEKLVDPADPCRVCYCQGGEVVCRRIACFVRDDCTPRLVPGRCCPEYDNCPLRGVTSLPGQSSMVPNVANGDNMESPPVPSKENIKQEITIKEITPVSEIPVITEVKIKEILPSPSIDVAEYSSSKSPLIPREATSERNFKDIDSKTESPSVVEVHLSSPVLAPEPTLFTGSDNKDAEATPSKISFSTQDSIHSSIFPSNVPIVAIMGVPAVTSEPTPVVTTKSPIIEEEDSFDHNPAFPPLPDDLSVLRNHEDEIVPEQAGDNEHVHENLAANVAPSNEPEPSSSIEPLATTRQIYETSTFSTIEASKTTSEASSSVPEITISTQAPSFKENPMPNLRSAIPTEILNVSPLIPESTSRESEEKILINEERTIEYTTTENNIMGASSTETPETSTETKTPETVKTTPQVTTTSAEITSTSQVPTTVAEVKTTPQVTTTVAEVKTTPQATITFTEVKTTPQGTTNSADISSTTAQFSTSTGVVSSNPAEETTTLTGVLTTRADILTTSAEVFTTRDEGITTHLDVSTPSTELLTTVGNVASTVTTLTSNEVETTPAENVVTSFDTNTSKEHEASFSTETDRPVSKFTENETDYNSKEEEQTTSSISKSNVATEFTLQIELSSLPIETSDQNPPEILEQTTSDKAMASSSTVDPFSSNETPTTSEVITVSRAASNENSGYENVETTEFILTSFGSLETSTDAVELIKISASPEKSGAIIDVEGGKKNTVLTDLFNLVSEFAFISDHTNDPTTNQQLTTTTSISDSEELIPVNAGYKSKNKNFNQNSITEVPFKNKIASAVNKPKVVEIEDDESESVTDSLPPNDKVEPTTRRPIIDNVSDDGNMANNKTIKKDIEIITQSYVPTINRRPTKVVMKKSNEKPASTSDELSVVSTSTASPTDGSTSSEAQLTTLANTSLDTNIPTEVSTAMDTTVTKTDQQTNTSQQTTVTTERPPTEQ